MSRTEIVMAAATAAVCFSAAVSAVFFWMDRGVCADMTVSASVSAVCLICLIYLIRKILDAREAEAGVNDTVYLVLTSVPPKKEEKRIPKGKMPNH